MIDRKICPVMTAGAMVCGRCALWDSLHGFQGIPNCSWSPVKNCGYTDAGRPCARPSEFRPSGEPFPDPAREGE